MLASDKTPRQIVNELDKYVVGQDQAKKAIAVALRNRYRRMQLPVDMQEEVTPKNVLMIGPTGVGKTEIARRLAKIVHAPFVKVEATKFTEVGYVGRDVESMVRDMVEVAYKMEEEESFKNVRSQATSKANKRLVKLLVPVKKKETKANDQLNFTKMMRDLQNGNFADYLNQAGLNGQEENPNDVTDEVRNERLNVNEQLQKGLLENTEITIDMDDPAQALQGQNDMLGQMGLDLNALGSMMPKRRVKRTLTVKEAREVFIREESEKMVNAADLADAAIQRAQNTGLSLSMKLIRLLQN